MNAPKPHPVGMPCTIIFCPWRPACVGQRLIPSSENLHVLPLEHPNYPGGIAPLWSRSAVGQWVQEVRDASKTGFGLYPVRWMVHDGTEDELIDEITEAIEGRGLATEVMQQPFVRELFKTHQ